MTPAAILLRRDGAAADRPPSVGGTLIPLARDAARSRAEAPGAAAGPRRSGRGLAALSMRDEEICLRSQDGELPHDIARALGHDLLDVMRALNRAIALGLSIRP